MEIFFARQGIYDRKNRVTAYELLFDRNTNHNKDKEEAQLQLICNCGTIGMSHFVNNKKAFVKFSEIALLEDIPSLLGKDIIVVEISQNFIINIETKKAIEELVEDNYTIALNDTNNLTKIKDFGELINIYKIDFKETSKYDRKNLIKGIERINTKAIFMACNISTEEEYKEAVEENYYYFQGEYFSKVVVIKDKDMSVRNINRFNIIIELLKEDFEIDKVEYIIKSDVGISYKLMRFLNSSTFAFVQKINSIRQAIILLGRDELKKWLTLIVISEMQLDTNEELSNNTIIRGRLCELIASKVCNEKKSHAFLVGLFSNLEVFMGEKMEVIVEDLPVEDEVKEALVGKENMLTNVLSLVKAYEEMEMEKIEYYSDKIQLDKNELLQLYLDSIDWLNQLTVNLK